MDPERWQQIEEIYYSILEAPAGERKVLLDRACQGDADLRREIESLLRSEDRVGDFLSPEKLRGQISRLGSLPKSPSVGSALGDYEIVSVLGAGAMGEVYRARDRRLGREVALKILPPHLTSDAGRVARFQAEARAASSLNHPNTVTIYEIGQASGAWFIAAELIPGVTLRERLKNGKLAPEEALNIAIACANALQAAHSAGIVHRDIKPENIMIRPDGAPKVVDFGLARILEPQQDWSIEATQTGSLMGTPRYMSPEQAHGHKPDARSDIFSMGAVLYEMVTGRPAFPGSTTAEVFAALLGSEPDLSDTGPWTGIIAKAIAKDPAARYQRMEELAGDLRNFDPAKAAPLVSRHSRLWQVHRGKVAAAVLLAVVAGIAAYAWISRPEAPADTNLKVTQLTTFGGTKAYPVFSPDGSRIAFCWRPSAKETSHVYLKPAGTGEPTQLTFGSEEDIDPAWSPDGKQIAFVRRNAAGEERGPVPSDAYVVSSHGGEPRKIAEGCEGVSWSPDGKTLAVARVPARSPDSGGIDLLSLATGERRRLTASREDLLPAYSFNGKWIAFIRVLPGRGRARDLFVVPAAGGEARQITFDGEYTTGAAWTTDSREIVFSSPRDQTRGAFWRIPVSGGEPRPLSATLRNASFPAISPRGNRLVFNESWSDSNIHLRTAPGFPHAAAPWRFDTPLGVVLSTGTDHSPDFSPDGERFAFVSDRTGTNQIWVAQVDGSHQSQLTTYRKESPGSPHWSPDGEWIAFDLWASRESNVYVVSSRGGAARRASMEPGESWNPSWSPDGRWIYFTSRRSGTSEIWKMPVSGGPAIQITHRGAFEGRPSPDGKTIYFRKTVPTGCCAIWSTPAGGGPEEPVRELERFSTVSRSWGVIQDGVYFIARENQPRQAVRFLSFATHEVSEVVKLDKEPDWSFLGLAMSPDGRHLLSVQVDRESNDLMMIDNFR